MVKLFSKNSNLQGGPKKLRQIFIAITTLFFSSSENVTVKKIIKISPYLPKLLREKFGAVFWPTLYVITIHQRHKHTDRDARTDRRHAIAIPRFALKCIAR